MRGKNKIKICLVCSAGGHFYQMFQLKSWWSKYSRFWVTFNRVDTKESLKGERVFFGHFPENRNVINAIKNLYLAIRILVREKPDVIFSTGAGIAPPFFLVGKILGAKLIYIETASFVGIPTLTGKMIYPLVDIFLIQHTSSKKFFPKAKMAERLV